MTPERVVIGNAELWHGDCREVLPLLDSVDAVITDPPYELPQTFGTSTLYGARRMAFEFDKQGVTDDVVIPAMALALDRCRAFHCFLNPEQYGAIATLARKRGFTPKPWAKRKLCPPAPMPGNWWPSAFELAMYGYQEGAWFGDTSARRSNLMTYDSYRHNIRADEKVDHPTQKWLPMVAYLVQTIVPPRGGALDPFMGSGTTGVACALLGRAFIGIEDKRKYFEIACERIEAAQRQAPLIPPEPAAVPVQETML